MEFEGPHLLPARGATGKRSPTPRWTWALAHAKAPAAASTGLSRGVTDIRLTHIGGPTLLIEVDGWRILTDPTFDPPGQRYAFGWGTSSPR